MRPFGGRVPARAGNLGGLSRRDFFKASAGGGFALGSLFGLGLDLRAAQEDARHIKFHNVREVPSVCPYCAVGWTQHTVGVQMIRAAAVVQLLLGNIGRPGAASWPCAATPPSRARPTSPRCTTSCPVTSTPPAPCASTTP